MKFKNKRYLHNPIFVSFLTFFTMLLFYVFLVWIWDTTSVEYKPANFLDLEVKTPVYQEDWLKRREGGLKS